MYSTRPLVAMLCGLVTLGGYADGSAAPECKRFSEIYANGKELCENMWDGAFVYETDESKGYTMWFFDAVNPNDATARALGKLSGAHDTCHLESYHKDAPGPEPDNFTECHPWKSEACCHHGTVETRDKINEGYGKEYHWDRCGKLSHECDRFFVQEGCFYECDANLGLYRKFHTSAIPTGRPGTQLYNESDKSHNKWKIHAMPIKASYCDAWFTACHKDKFCSSSGGDYFSCGAEYKKYDEAAELKAEIEKAKKAQEEDDEMGVGIIIAFVAAGVAICALCACGCCLVMRERAGKPVFGTL